MASYSSKRKDRLGNVLVGILICIGIFGATYLGGCAVAHTAQAATLTPCFGAPATYVTAFDTVRGQGKNGAVTYPEARVYLEWQSWATPNGETPGHHSEHMHFGACVPQGATVTTTFDLDLAYTFHNMVDYNIDHGGEQAVVSTGGQTLWNTTPAQEAQLEAAMDASGTGTTSAYFSVTTQPTTSGPKEVRGGLTVVQSGPSAVFEIWALDSRWYYTSAIPGQPQAANPPVPAKVAYIRMRTMADWDDAKGHHHDYHHSGFGGDSEYWMRSTFTTYWSSKSLLLQVTDGGGPGLAMVDPDFHNHYAAPTPTCPNVDALGNCLGRWFQDLGNNKFDWAIAPDGGAWQKTVTVPASSLGSGLHRFVFRSDDSAPTRGTWSNVVVLPFRVR